MEDLGVPLGRLDGRSDEVMGVSTHLVHDVFKRIGAVNGKAHEDDVGLGVGQRTQTVVFLLAGCIPQGQLDHLARGRMGSVGDVVLEHGRHIFLDVVRHATDGRRETADCRRGTYLGKVAGAVADQQARLAAAAVADHDELLGVGGRLGDGSVVGGGGGIGADGAIAVPLAGGSLGLADGCGGRCGRLCALLATQVVVVLRGRRSGHGAAWAGCGM